MFVPAGANVEEDTLTGNTPLHVAVAVLIVLKNGTSVNKQNVAGETPLNCCCAAFMARRGGTAGVVDLLLLRQGADEKVIADNGLIATGVVGSLFERQETLEETKRVKTNLANAPADRAWHRRGFLVLCLAHCLSGRVELGQGRNHTHATGIAKKVHSGAAPSRAEVDRVRVASMLNGTDLKKIVGFL